MKIIDPHLHLFNLNEGDYHWLKADKPPFWPDKKLINRAFKENNLELKSALELAGFVHIEAGFDNNQPWRELASLEQTCSKPFRAIANIDLTVPSQKFTQNLEKLAKFHSFIGVRHILDEQALNLLTNKQVLNNFKTLNNFAANTTKGLIFEAQLTLSEETPVNAFSEVVNNSPNISFVINHAGFPPVNIQTIEWQRWQSNLLKLSMYPHVAIKCSGWEMTDRNYRLDWQNESLALIFELFGKHRMMLASNFPLCLFSRSSYQDYWQSLINGHFFQALTEQEKSALCYDNALKWYQFSKIV